VNDADAARSLTHGFHSYAARFHPLMVRRLISDLPQGATLCDPFCGSGTALVEAALRGVHTFGVDVNPLAVQLTRLKATVWPFERRMELLESARGAAERSRGRVSRRARTRESGERYDDPRAYAPHVFRELVGLREEIAAERDATLREALLLVLSSILVKVSRQRSDTAQSTVERAIGKGLPTKLFVRKAEELTTRMSDFAAKVPRNTPPPDVRLGDARKLSHLKDASVDVVVTSPPYLGTYDYAAHQARRFGWLEVSAEDRAFADKFEIGARRNAKPAEWQHDVAAFTTEIARILRPGAHAFLAIGDSAVGDRPIAGDEPIRAAASKAGLTLLAWASQSRPSFNRRVRNATRREHLLLLAR
jgi:DNA modification methylase